MTILKDNIKDNGAIIDLTLKFPLNAPQLKLAYSPVYLKKTKKNMGHQGKFLARAVYTLSDFVRKMILRGDYKGYYFNYFFFSKK